MCISQLSNVQRNQMEWFPLPELANQVSLSVSWEGVQPRKQLGVIRFFHSIFGQLKKKKLISIRMHLLMGFYTIALAA